MRIRLSDPEFEHVCKTHGIPMSLEDWDSSYHQATYICPVEGCRERTLVGPSDVSIYQSEMGMGERGIVSHRPFAHPSLDPMLER